MSNRSLGTSKGNRTRAARRTFTKTFGEISAGIVRMLASGVAPSRVAQLTGAPRTTVATYKANLTRGVYAPFVRGNGSGSCNFRG